MFNMFKPYRLLAWLSIALATSSPQAAFGFSSSQLAQLPTPPPPPPPPSTSRTEDVPLCYIRISGSTVNLHQLCGMSPNQANPNSPLTGVQPSVSNRSNSPLSNALDAEQRSPVSFGTGSAYADDGRR